MAEELDFDAFLNHSAGGKGGGGSFLENWREEGSIQVWLHPRANIHPVWYHNWYRLDTGDKDNPLTEYKAQRFNCLEHEDILKKARFRHNDGTREHPPQVCPHCLMMEWVRDEIRAGRLSWLKPVFKFGQDQDARILLAGGLTGMFGAKDLADAKKVELKRAGVRLDEVYLQDGKPQLNYVMRAISHADPKDGAKITFIKQSLGDKLKKAIRDRADAFVLAGSERSEADIRTNPVCFLWKFNEKESFDKKYDCICLERVKITPEVQAAMDMDPPDVSHLVGPSNLDQHYASMEEHALIPMPFEQFFAPIEARTGRKVGVVPDDLDDGEDEDDVPEDWGGTGVREEDKPKKAAAAKSKKAEPEVELFACDKCQKVCLKDEDLVCPECGAEYEVGADGYTVLKPEPPKRRRGKST